VCVETARRNIWSKIDCACGDDSGGSATCCDLSSQKINWTMQAGRQANRQCPPKSSSLHFNKPTPHSLHLSPHPLSHFLSPQQQLSTHPLSLTLLHYILFLCSVCDFFFSRSLTLTSRRRQSNVTLTQKPSLHKKNPLPIIRGFEFYLDKVKKSTPSISSSLVFYPHPPNIHTHTRHATTTHRP